MSNPSKAKGTRYENVVLDHLAAAGYIGHRTAAGSDSHDIRADGLPPIEAKHHKTPRLALWINRLRKAHGSRWLLFMKIGDQRTDGYEVVVMPVDVWIEMNSR